MRRVAVESLVVGAAVGAATLGWFGGVATDVVCGAEGGAFAWRVGQMAAWAAGAAPLADDAGVAVPVAGLPWMGLGALLAPLTGVGGAWSAALAIGVGAGAAALWGLTRAAGAGVAAAALAVGVGALPPVLAESVGAGGVDLAVVPLVALGLALLPGRPGRERGAARAVGFAAIVLCGLADARTGAVAGLAAAAAGGGGWALLAALLAAGAGTAAPAAAGFMDPVDVTAPLLTLRPEGVGPGLAAVVAAGWIVRDAGLRRAALVGFVCALGPVLTAFGDALTIGDAALPLPAAAVAAFAPAGGWGGALIVAAVAAGLGLGRLGSPRWSLLLVPVAVLEIYAVATEPPACVTLDAPVAVRALGERRGGVLHLPVAVTSDLVDGAPAAAHGLYLAQRRLHGRPVANGIAPLGASDPLYGEPAVVLTLGAEALLVPPTRPGEVLRGLGVTEIVVHRRLFPPGALAVVDPLLARLYGAPQRDHAGDVDLYRVAAEGPSRAPTPEVLRGIDSAPPPGWLDAGAYLAGIAGPVGAGPGGAGADGGDGAIPGGAEAPGTPGAGAPGAGAPGAGAPGTAVDGPPDGGRAPGEGPRRGPRPPGARGPRGDAGGPPGEGADPGTGPRRPRQSPLQGETPP